MIPKSETEVDILIESCLSHLSCVWKNVCLQTPLPDEYLVHDVEDDRPEEYAGDTDTGITYYRRVHLYAKRDKYNPGIKPAMIRKALRDNGFIITGTGEVDDKNGYTHIIIFAYLQGNINE